IKPRVMQCLVTDSRHDSPQPFLRWPGGKRWLVPIIMPIVESLRPTAYFEPFLGGGAVFFSLKCRPAVLSDINEDLINAYIQVRERPVEIVSRLRALPVSERDYDRLRTASPRDPLDRAVRFLYLNRTAFSGLYRVNRLGVFTVPVW